MERGYSDFLVEIGGEIRSSNNQRDSWIIGIQNPKENSIINKIQLNNKSMATSGTYNNFFTYKEKDQFFTPADISEYTIKTFKKIMKYPLMRGARIASRQTS